MARAFVAATTQYLVNTTPPLTAIPLTMACRFRSNDATTRYYMMSVSADDGDRIGLGVRGEAGGDPIDAQAYNGANSNPLSTTGYSANTWHHACCVAAASNSLTVYLDGGGKATVATDVPCSAFTRMHIGCIYWHPTTAIAYPLDGQLAECAIWNVALTDAEVAILAKGYSPLLVRPQSLVGYWPTVGRTSPEIDIVGGYDMTLVNTPTVAVHPRVLYPTAYRLGVPIPAVVAGRIPRHPAQYNTLAIY